MKWVIRLFGGLLVLVLLAIIGAFGWSWTALPQTDGSLRVSGIKSQAEILRSRHGVPIIRADDAVDLYFALGFAHAQDRLWQMDIQRRLGQGRLAEVIGSEGVKVDRVMRTLGLYRLAQQDYERMEIKNAVDSYAAGVNAYIESIDHAWPLEFDLLQYRPEPWVPADTMLVGRMMAVMLSVNFQSELVRYRLLDTMSADQVMELYPPYPVDGVVSIPELPELLDPALLDSEIPEVSKETQPFDSDFLDELSSLLRESLPTGGASNALAISGVKTINNDALLAADPHLSYSAPGFWYLVRLEGPNVNLSGATIPGGPYITIGHNSHIAWAFTTSYLDTQDLFVEKISLDDPTAYEAPTGPLRFRTREEIIKVRDAEDVTLTVRETRHGPVISDAYETITPPEGKVLALKATALMEDNNTIQALQKMNWAQTVWEFQRALQEYVAPAQNITFADRFDNIGMISAGRIPRRVAGEGLFPRAGWLSDDAWSDFLAFEELPQTLNPPMGMIVNANNKMTASTDPTFQTHNFQPPYRAQRIESLLKTPREWSAEDMAIILNDVYSPMAEEMLPLFLNRLDTLALDETGRQALNLLQDWDRVMDKDKAAPLIYMMWSQQIYDHIVGDELDKIDESYRAVKPIALQGMLRQHTRWCDDVATPEAESCEDQVQSAFKATVDTLVNLYGMDPTKWRWGDMHQARFDHTLFRYVPIAKDILIQRFPISGGPQTVNRQQMNFTGKDSSDDEGGDEDEQRPNLSALQKMFDSVHGPGLRVIFDMENLDQTMYMIAPGQSGHLLSSNYRDLADLWQQGKYIRINREAGEFRELSQGTLTLLPK